MSTTSRSPVIFDSSAASGLRAATVPSQALVIVARPPSAPNVKTRLAAGVGDATARTTYRRLLEDTMGAVQRAAAGAFRDRVHPMVAWAPDGGHGVSCPPVPAAAWSALVQRGQGLGSRLGNLLSDAFEQGWRAVTLVGSDSPALPPEYVEDALALLGGAESGPDVVVGPTTDGGYYLLGLRRDAWDRCSGGIRDLLRDAPLGTSHARDATVTGLLRLGLSVRNLPYWVDVDLPGDLPLAARLQDRMPGRAGPAPGLRTVYLHVTHRCGGTCLHCYDRESSARPRELSTEGWLDVIRQAVRLGARRFEIIGGDPFLRPDLLELTAAITGTHQAAARLFCNPHLDQAAVAAVADASNGRLTPLLSIDGKATVNDRLRGPGSTDRVLAVGRLLVGAGLTPVVNTVLARPVAETIDELPALIAASQITRLHLILPHARGAMAKRPHLIPSGEELRAAFEKLLPAAERAGVTVDNIGAWKARLRTPRDLCDAGCSLATIGPTGSVYGCPITCGDPGFAAGDVTRRSLASIWRDSPAFFLLRQSRARDRETCASCPVVDACGGECWVQAHYAAAARSAAAGPNAPFPYCDLVRPVLEEMRGEALIATDDARERMLTPFDCI